MVSEQPVLNESWVGHWNVSQQALQEQRGSVMAGLVRPEGLHSRGTEGQAGAETYPVSCGSGYMGSEPDNDVYLGRVSIGC